MAKKEYSAEFKMETVKRIETTGEPVARVSSELGINANTVHGWIKRYQHSPTVPFPGSGKLSPEDEAVHKIKKENRELREENEILKKAAVYFAKNLK